jgi:hypothetical protein
MGRSGVMLAWLAGLGIIGYRQVARQHHAPFAGKILGASMLFALLGLLAEVPAATGFANALAWGFDLAALLDVLPQGLGGSPKTAPKSPAGGIVPTPSGKPAPNITGSTGQA